MQGHESLYLRDVKTYSAEDTRRNTNVECDGTTNPNLRNASLKIVVDIRWEHVHVQYALQPWGMSIVMLWTKSLAKVF